MNYRLRDGHFLDPYDLYSRSENAPGPSVGCEFSKTLEVFFALQGESISEELFGVGMVQISRELGHREVKIQLPW